MERIVLLGPPGSGKGTQAELLEKKENFIRLSTGDLLREEIKNESEFGKKVKHYLDNGLLVPDSIITEFILLTIENKKFYEKKVVFDGFPRRISQAEALDKKLKEFSSEIDAAILIKLEEEEIIKRLTNRLVCPECKKIYPGTHTSQCDNCGTTLIKRSDDNKDVILKRIKVYNNETLPLIEYFEKIGKLININGIGSIEEVNNNITKVIKNNE